MSDTSIAKIAQKSPYIVQVEAGRKYAWCSCGYSQNQPFCDGAHRDTTCGLKSIKYIATENKSLAFCGCKQTKNAPFCDGAHSKL